MKLKRVQDENRRATGLCCICMRNTGNELVVTGDNIGVLVAPYFCEDCVRQLAQCEIPAPLEPLPRVVVWQLVAGRPVCHPEAPGGIHTVLSVGSSRGVGENLCDRCAHALAAFINSTQEESALTDLKLENVQAVSDPLSGYERKAEASDER